MLQNIWKNGAPEGNNLEPDGCVSLLEELDSWSAILKAEPELIHRLDAFAAAAAREAPAVEEVPAPPAPSAPEPSP